MSQRTEHFFFSSSALTFPLITPPLSLSLSAVGPPYTLRLKVKFYSPEPNTLREELTRYQFFLQLKQDLLDGRLECEQAKAIELCSLALQCETAKAADFHCKSS